MVQRLALNVGRQVPGRLSDSTWRLYATQRDKQNNAVSYGNDWYKQTREATKRRTTREEIGECSYHSSVLAQYCQQPLVPAIDWDEDDTTLDFTRMQTCRI